jgi:UDP-N-acetylmuramate dehydrogenase
MMTVEENVNLQSLNTFGIQCTAQHLVRIHSIDQLKVLLELKLFQHSPKLVLGGGSNLLFTKKIFRGLVIKNEIKGIRVVQENEDHIWLKVGGGEEWHAFVMHCVANNFGGVENLSLIPGLVGAAPMQNIGAYGVEVKDTIHSVTAFEFQTGALHEIDNAHCRFGYRESMFKQEGKGKYFITHVTFRLSKRNHRFHVEYGAIKEILTKMNINELSLKSISDAVIQIRQSKLPDPRVIGNAGSFFKNPTILLSHYQSLKQYHPSIPSFTVDDDHVKVPAAWLIESCGWKGKTLDSIGVHKHQALVLVNYGGGDGDKLVQLARDIQHSVHTQFNITLQTEVNIINDGYDE